MRSVVIGCFLVLTATAASAQDVGQVGVTMGFPASIGVIWHATDQIALRPEIGVSHTSSDGGLTASSGHAVSVGASALYYLRKWDAVRTYASPRYSYSNTGSSGTVGSTTQTLTGPSTTTIFTTESSSGTHTITASYGAQYMPTPHFAVYGEAGFGYSHASTTSQNSLSGTVTNVSGLVTNLSPPTVNTQNVWATRGGVGVVLYF